MPKKNKYVFCCSNNCPIALASSLSKLLEHVILIHCLAFLYTSPLQFGFKPGSSTALCTGLVKNTIIHSGSSVHGCFLDASKVFDLVGHSLLFQKLIEHGLSLWCSSQLMEVRWDKSLCKMSNGVRQGGVLSPILFTEMTCSINC